MLCAPATYSLPLMAAAQASERGVTRQNSVVDVGQLSSLSSYTQEHACVRTYNRCCSAKTLL